MAILVKNVNLNDKKNVNDKPVMDKPVNSRFYILDINKIAMCKFWYNYTSKN